MPDDNLDLSRLAAGKVTARISVFGIHIAAFGATYHLASNSLRMSIAMIVLSGVCLLAEIVLAEHFSALTAGRGLSGIETGLRLRHVFILWYLFSVAFWGYTAYSNAL